MLTNETPLKAERHTRIRKLVEQKGQVLVGELSQSFEVSEATIRRDLEELASQGWIQRTHGGAVRVERFQGTAHVRRTTNSAQKERIGRAAAL
jgi:DeoR family transcriptional regulator of aga operon